jgi:WD40 repeat protein
VLSAAFNPKGNRLVTASEDATAVIWDLFSGHEPKTLRHDNEVHDAIFNQDGSTVLTVSRDQSARLWDAESGEPISPPLGHPASLWHGVFLDENSFLTSDDKGNSWIWEVTTDPRPVEHLMLIAEILNGTRPAVSTSTATTETSYTVWRNMKDKYPQEFATSRPELIAWHRQQAALSSQERQWAAALFHYNRLLVLDSNDEEIIRLRAEAVRRLEAPHPASVSR